jgi:hypothetical protein
LQQSLSLRSDGSRMHQRFTVFGILKSQAFLINVGYPSPSGLHCPPLTYMVRGVFLCFVCLHTHSPHGDIIPWNRCRCQGVACRQIKFISWHNPCIYICMAYLLHSGIHAYMPLPNTTYDYNVLEFTTLEFITPQLHTRAHI